MTYNYLWFIGFSINEVSIKSYKVESL